MAKRLCKEQVDPECISSLLNCRLIALAKEPPSIEEEVGVRPIGVGEILRRIIGKAVMGVLKEEIKEAVGPLQTCSGHKSGCEAAIHAARSRFNEPECKVVIIVDAENAFNQVMHF